MAVGARLAIAGEHAFRTPLVAAFVARGATIVETVDATIDAVIVLHGLATGQKAASVTPYLATLAAAQAFGRDREARPGCFVMLTNRGGAFGLDASGGAHPWLGGFSGIAKTAAIEWPHVDACAIDLPETFADAETLACRVVDECFRTGSEREIGFAADGTRFVVRETDRPVRRARQHLPDRPVLIATGGGRGILPACLKALAETGIAPRIAIFGRTPLANENGSAPIAVADLPGHFLAVARAEGRALTPLQLRAEVGTVTAAREVRTTIQELEASGAEVRYRALDVTDVAEVRSAVDGIRAEWGRIDGLVHGAGVLADKPIVEQTPERFTTVFTTKIAGLRALLDATKADALSAIVLFSSVAARYGNVGQVAYAAANEILNAVARAEAVRRGPTCLVRALNWGPWDGGMVTDGLRAAFRERGIPVIPLAEGARAFADEFWSGTDAADVDVVLAMAPPRI